MTFDEWYEKNAENLTASTFESALKEAWEAGITHEKALLLKGFLRGMKEGMEQAQVVKWHTRSLEGAVSERTCGFESRPGHKEKL